MNDDRELETWKREWTAMGSAAHLVERLAGRARRNVVRARIGGAVEALAALASTSLCAWFAVRSHGDPSVIALALGVSTFNGIWLTRYFLQQPWRTSEARDVHAYVELLRVHAEARHSWLRFAERSSIGASAAVIGWSAWFVHGHWHAYAGQEWRAWTGAGIAVGICCVVLGWLRRARHHHERQTLFLERELRTLNMQ